MPSDGHGPTEDFHVVAHEISIVAGPLLEEFSDRPVMVVLDEVNACRHALIDLTGHEPEPEEILLLARAHLRARRD